MHNPILILGKSNLFEYQIIQTPRKRVEIPKHIYDAIRITQQAPFYQIFNTLLNGSE